MGRTLRDVIAALPVDQRACIEARFRELMREIEDRKLNRICDARADETAVDVSLKDL